MQIFLYMIKRELALHMARKGEWISVLLFYAIVMSLFPIALGTWPQESLWLAPVIIWIAALIAVVLAQESLLRADFKLGVFDQLILSEHSFSLLLLAKILSHWLVYSLPMLIVTPLFALSFSLPTLSIVVITASLCLGTLFLSLVAAVGAALTVRLARGGTFLAMLILPLYIPVLTIGADVGILSLDGIVSKGHFALLGASLIIALCGVPLAVATALKVSME